MKGRPASESLRFLQRQAAAERAANQVSRLRGLRLMAVKIYMDRNASGAPERSRTAIRAEMRPFLRESLHWLVKARAALRAGDVDRYELLRDRARMYHAFAMLELFQPYANRQGENIRSISSLASKGGKERAAKIAADRCVDGKPSLDELYKVIAGCVQRSERMRPKEWASQYGVSVATVNRRISAARNGK